MSDSEKTCGMCPDWKRFLDNPSWGSCLLTEGSKELHTEEDDKACNPRLREPSLQQQAGGWQACTYECATALPTESCQSNK